jgi:ABC-type uncharacterized transport system involved in gliding motility auxiliary subunit
MNERSKQFLIGAAILLLSLAAPFETSFSQEQGQLIKPCMAETTPEKKEDTTKPKNKKRRKRPKTKDEKKDRNESKNSNCN